MNVIGLDGRMYKLKLDDTEREGSSGHELAKTLLKSLFPHEKCYEETFIPGCGTPLYLDLFIPRFRLGVEIQGQQHFAFCPFFHGTINDFRKSQKRDNIKREWGIRNNIRIAYLNDADEIGVWRESIIKAYSSN